MKPQVYVPGSWTGFLDFNTDEDWESWEEDYREYILEFAQISDSLGIEIFCIGTEFKIASKKREKFWRSLIEDVRSIYNGKITYASNWDFYDQIPFWDALDYIGVNAYFPLVEDKTPKVADLKEAWKPLVKKLEEFYERTDKPILFTEFGYLSVDGCAFNTWEIEPRVKSTPINEQAQANALEALFSTFYPNEFWHGGFLWKWFPNGQGHEGYIERDYTPSRQNCSTSTFKMVLKKLEATNMKIVNTNSELRKEIEAARKN